MSSVPHGSKASFSSAVGCTTVACFLRSTPMRAASCARNSVQRASSARRCAAARVTSSCAFCSSARRSSSQARSVSGPGASARGPMGSSIGGWYVDGISLSIWWRARLRCGTSECCGVCGARSLGSDAVGSVADESQCAGGGAARPRRASSGSPSNLDDEAAWSPKISLISCSNMSRWRRAEAAPRASGSSTLGHEPSVVGVVTPESADVSRSGVTDAWGESGSERAPCPSSRPGSRIKSITTHASDTVGVRKASRKPDFSST